MAGKFFVALAMLVGLAAPAASADRPDDGAVIAVDIDNARVLKMPRPAATVIIGNPAIADVSVQDASTMVLTGRSYGITNLIVLDEHGETMIDRQVGVRNSENGTVRVYRQAERQTLSCSPRCEPTATIGDTSYGFGTTSQQVQDRQKLAAVPASDR